MYYEEQVIDGQLCYRTTPDGPWAVVEYKELVDRVVFAEKKVRQLESELESFIGPDPEMEEDARVSGKIRRQSRAAIVAYSADCPLL